MDQRIRYVSGLEAISGLKSGLAYFSSTISLTPLLAANWRVRVSKSVS